VEIVVGGKDSQGFVLLAKESEIDVVIIERVWQWCCSVAATW